MKMDVEGAEKLLLTDNYEGWAPRVKTMLIELHSYHHDQFLSDIEKIGFVARKHSRHWESFFAVRKDLA